MNLNYNPSKIKFSSSSSLSLSLSLSHTHALEGHNQEVLSKGKATETYSFCGRKATLEGEQWSEQ